MVNRISTSSPPIRGLTVRRVPIATLHLDPANARSHGPINLEAIKGSLSRFGQAEPLIVQAGTGRIIGGNGRLVAMQALGWTECDIVEVDLPAIEATALGLALNRTGELAEWDNEALGRLLEQLRAEDAVAGIGFSPEDINDILAQLAVPGDGAVDDQGPQDPPQTPVTQPGDLWLFGNHRLLCGDSTSTADLARLLAGETAALLSTDPPYCVEYTGMDRPIHDGKPSGKDWSAVYNEVDIKDLGAFLDGVFTACLPRLAPDAAVYVWHAHVQQPTIAAAFERHELLLHQILVWVKPSATFGHSYYRWKHEPCAFGWRTGHKPKHGFGQLDSVWELDWEGKARTTTFHPTSKPVRLFEIPIEVHTKPGAIVLEPFGGSGSQIIAAEKLGRRARVMEIQPAFVDGMIRRWETATGKLATLQATGQTLAQVAADRGVPAPGGEEAAA